MIHGQNGLLYVNFGERGPPCCGSWQKWAPVCESWKKGLLGYKSWQKWALVHESWEIKVIHSSLL